MALDITFPDGNVKQFPDGTTVKAITEGISNSLAKKAVAGKLDGDLIAYDEPIAHSGQLQIMTKDDAEGLTVLRQTAAFVLAAALKDYTRIFILVRVKQRKTVFTTIPIVLTVR